MDAAVKEKNTPYQMPAVAVEASQVRVGGGKVYQIMKRLFDLLIATVAFVVLLIPMVIVGIVIRLDSPGPALFRQERLGKNGKPFMMYKFRSMRLDAEVNGPKWADKNDRRCTKVGRFLRKSRIDELPQLYNIIRGEMSFIGPRPERACFYDEFEKYIPHFRNRLLVRPGLTGHAQVNGGYELKPEEKIVYDMEYIANRSVKMDLLCLWRTVLVVFSHDGAR